MSALRPDAEGRYAWDRWECRALEAGLAPDLADLGRAVLLRMTQLLNFLHSLALALLLFVTPAIAEPADQAGVVDQTRPAPAVEGGCAGLFCPHARARKLRAGKIVPRAEHAFASGSRLGNE